MRSFTALRLLTTVSACALLSAGCDFSSSESKHVEVSPTPQSTQEILAQMHWPLKEAAESTRNPTHGRIEKLIMDDNAESKAKAIRELQESIEETMGPVQDAITETGTETKESVQQIERQIDLCYEYALLYALTGQVDYAHRSAAIMLRFGEVMPKWRLTDLGGERHNQDDAAYLRHWRANGFWRWHPLDLTVVMPMLRAYDLIRPALSDEQQQAIRNDLFLFHKSFIDRFTGLLPLYSNMAGYHLVSLIRFGIILDQPDFIHEVVRYWRDFVKFSYAPDGFFRELTPDYHHQISWRMANAIPAALKGYSDPEGYLNAETGTRFDNLDLEKENTAFLRQMRASLKVLALPDGTYANINDSWPKKMTSEESRQEASTPGVLGVSGLAKLGHSGMVALLNFDGIRGHDHHDALNLIWFAAGREVFSDTGYQPIPESGSSRRWHTITASHNTVAVDEQTQFLNRDVHAVPRRVAGFTAFPPKTKEDAPLQAALPAAAGFANQGKLLVWDVSNPEVQAMEAEQERAYAGITSLFRRTLVMVSLKDDEGYLVDIFRIRGGRTHDYFIRGGLDEAFTIQFDQELPLADSLAYEFIHVKRRGEVQTPIQAQIKFASGEQQVVSRLAGVFGSTPSKLEIFSGEAPAIRRTGMAPFSFVRHTSGDFGGDLETCFVWVHEATRGASKIHGIKAEEIHGAVAVTLDLGDREDVILSALDSESEVPFQDLVLKGKLAFVSNVGDGTTAHIHHGSSLRKGGIPIARRSPSLRGEIIDVWSRSLGDEGDSLFIHAPSDVGERDYRLAHIDLGDTIRFSVPIVNLEVAQKGVLRIDLAHAPGFLRNNEEIVMTQFPGWRIRALPSVTLE